jgi:hypothetical protein
MSTATNVYELLQAATKNEYPLGRLRESYDGLETMEAAEDDEPLFYEVVVAELDLREMISHTTVSEKIRLECLAELEAGRKSGWKLRD